MKEPYEIVCPECRSTMYFLEKVDRNSQWDGRPEWVHVYLCTNPSCGHTEER